HEGGSPFLHRDRHCTRRNRERLVIGPQPWGALGPLVDDAGPAQGPQIEAHLHDTAFGGRAAGRAALEYRPERGRRAAFPADELHCSRFCHIRIYCHAGERSMLVVWSRSLGRTMQCSGSNATQPVSPNASSGPPEFFSTTTSGISPAAITL